MFLKRVRKIVSVVAVLVLTAVIGYACIFNTFTLTRIVLPLLSSFSGVEMKAAYLDYVPFTGRAAGKDIRIGSEKYPWVRADEVHFTFDISAALRGKFRFYDVWIRGGDFQVCQYENGWSFGPPPVVCGESSAADDGAADDDDTSFEMRRITLRESTFKVRWGKRRKTGSFSMYGVSGYAEKFKKGRAFNGRLAGKIRLVGQKANRIDSGVAHILWHNQLSGDLIPERYIWKFRLDKLKGMVNGEPFDNTALVLNFTGRQKDGLFVADQLHLIQTCNGGVRSRLDFTGDLSPQIGAARGEVRNGRLSPELTALASEFFYGIDPGMVWLDYEGKFLWDQQQFNATGKFHIRREGDILIDRKLLPFPPMTFDGRYDFRLDREKREIDLAEFRLQAIRKEQQVASIQLRKPLKYRWKEGREDNTDTASQRAVFDIQSNGLELHLLKFILPPDEKFELNGGQLFSNITVTCHSDLRAFDIAGNCTLRHLSWTQEQVFRQLEEVRLQLAGILDKTLSFKLPELRLEVTDQNTLFGKLFLNGNWDHPAGKSHFTVKLQNLSSDLWAWCLQSPMPAFLKGQGEINFKGFFDAESDIVNISGFSAQQSLKNGIQLHLTAKPFTCDLTENKMLENVDFNFSAGGNAAALAELAAGNGFSIPEAGRLDCRVDGVVSREFNWMRFDGTCSARDLVCRTSQQTVKGVDAESRFSGRLNDMEQLEFQKAELYIRRQNQTALRLDCPGTLDIPSGGYLGDWKLRYLNDRFAGIFCDLNGMELSLAGDLQLTLSDNFRKQKLVAALQCAKWQIPGQSVVKGTLAGGVENTPEHLSVQQFDLTLSQKDTPFLILSAAGKLPHNSQSGNDTVLQLQTARLDLPRLMALRDAAVPETPAVPRKTRQKTASGRPPKPRLDLSSFPGLIDFELKNCTVTDGLDTDLKGSIRITPDKMSAESFRFRAGQSVFNGSLVLQNEAEGISLRSQLKGGEEPLAIRPVLELLIGTPLKGLQGEVSNLESRIFCLNDGGEGGWLNSLNGTFNADFQKLRIPGNLSNGPFGRLLLFPVDIAAQLVGFLPNDLENWKSRFSLLNSKDYSGIGVLQFDQGNVRLRSEAGKITVDYCRFLGPSVKRLSFEGDVELRDQQSIDLKARVSAVGGQTVIPIAGTLSDPELNWRTLATDPAMAALRKIRDLKLVGMEHQHHEKDEPLIVVSDLPGGIFLKKAHDFLKGLFQQE